jgi:flagellar assembly protein FliH
MLLPESQRLLKAHTVRELGARVAFNFDDLHQQGDQYLDRIRVQAAELLEAARTEAAAIREQAQREAKELGRREGLADAAGQIEARVAQLVEQQVRERVERSLPAVAAIAETLQREADEWRAHWETAAVQTALAIAEKIVHRTIDVHPAASRAMISQALQLAAGHPQLRVNLHPDDLTQLGPEAEKIIRTLSACAEAVIVPDSNVGRGGCRIETRHGEIDARIETILQRFAEELLA